MCQTKISCTHGNSLTLSPNQNKKNHCSKTDVNSSNINLADHIAPTSIKLLVHYIIFKHTTLFSLSMFIPNLLQLFIVDSFKNVIYDTKQYRISNKSFSFHYLFNQLLNFYTPSCILSLIHPTLDSCQKLQIQLPFNFEFPTNFHCTIIHCSVVPNLKHNMEHIKVLHKYPSFYYAFNPHLNF